MLGEAKIVYQIIGNILANIFLSLSKILIIFQARAC